MPNTKGSPSFRWNVQNNLDQAKKLNVHNNKELEKYKSGTDTYNAAKEELNRLRSSGINVDDLESELDKKYGTLSFKDKLGVVGRKIGSDYGRSAIKILGGTPNQTYSQKMDNAKYDREKTVNQLSTTALDVAMDPLTYAPTPFAKGASFTGKFIKNGAIGAGVSGGAYTARHYADDSYKLEDSLIAAGFGGVLNGAIAAALGRKIPKTKKDVIKKRVVEDGEPVADEALQDNFIDSDNKIADKILRERVQDFQLKGNTKDIYPKHSNPEFQQVKVDDDIHANLNMLSNKRIRKKDDNIKFYDSPEKIQHLINKALGNPTHKIRDQKSGYNMISNTNHRHNPTVFIDDQNEVKKWVKSAYNLRDEQVDNKLKEMANRGSVATQSAKSAPISHDESIIPNNINKSQGDGVTSTETITSSSPNNESIANIPQKNIIMNASPTIAGGAVGALGGATNDLDQDGKITYKDVLLGTAIGAGGTKLALKATDNLQGTKALESIKKIEDSDAVDAFTGHKISQKKDYMNLREKMISAKNSKMEDYAVLHEKLKLLSDDAKNSLHKYMSGDGDVKLSPSLKQFADSYKNQIKNEGQRLVDLGILDEAQYDRFKGKYLHRVYEKDITKAKDNLFSMGKTIKGVYTRGKEWTGTKAEYEKYLDSGELGSFHDGKIEARKLNNGQYKFSKDWTPEQRAKWGEIEDIAYTLPETLMRMNEMLEHGKMLRETLNTKYVADEAIDGYTQLNGKKFGALNGKYVPKDVADDITEFNRSLFGEDDGAIFSKDVKEAFSALSTFWKKSHTVYNPTAHINNLFSNITMQYMEGINPIKAITNARKGALAHAKLGKFRELTAKTLIGLSDNEKKALKALSEDDDLKLYLQANKAGLFGRSKLNDILGQYVNKTKKNKAGIFGKIDEVTSKYYEGEDNIMRFSLLKSLLDKGESFDDAIKQVNNTIPDYTKPMSRMARFGRKSMLTPFISWTYYSTPIILRQLKDNPQRAVALLGALYGINKAMGIDPYDNKDIPQQNFSMKRIPIYKDGKEVATIKVDRWIPHNDILSPIDFVRNLYNGGAWKGAYEVLNNQNLYYGGKITHNTGVRKAYDIGKYAVQQITPDIVDKVWNLSESAILTKNKRKKQPVIQPRSTIQELLNIAGLNTLTYDKQAQRKKAISEILKK